MQGRKKSSRQPEIDGKTRRISTLVIAFAFLATPPALAEGPQGVAYVVAPEQSFGLCFADNADSAFSCARTKCTANGTQSSDCLRVKWCYPAGWSADLFLQHREGPHWHQYLCGWPSREDAEAAAKLVCEGSQKEWLIECSVVGLWDPEGNARNLEDNQP